MKKLLILFSLALAGCVEVDTGFQPMKYAVYSLISPQDSLINVMVGKVYGNDELIVQSDDMVITNAEVSLINHKDTLHLLFSDESNLYQALNDGFIKSGEEYFLSIKVDDVVMAAQTTVPQNPEMRLAEYNVMIEDNLIEIKVEWEGSGKRPEYYRLSSYGFFQDDNNIRYGHVAWGSGEPLFVENGVTTKGLIESPYGNLVLYDSYDSVEISVTLESQDENLYRLNKSMDAMNGKLDIFAQLEPPVFLESNVKNGLGHFGSYVRNEIVINQEL